MPEHDRSDTDAGTATYARVAVSGSVWTTAQTLTNKLASLGAIYFLARLLSPDDFGLANLAVSIGAFALVVPPYVMGDVLMASPRSFDQRSGAAFAVVLTTGALLAALLFLIAGPVESVSGRVGIGAVLLFVALRPVSDAFMIVPMARLRIDLAYRCISAIDGLVILAATVSSVVLAWFGFGPIALVVPPIATLALKGALYWLVVRGEVSLRVRPGEMRRVGKSFLVAGTGQYLNNIIAILELLVMGLFASEAELGYFAFAFQLAIQANSIISGQLGAVLQPIFGRLHGEPTRQAIAFVRSAQFLAAFAVPLSLIQAAIAQPLFVACFGAKWMPSAAAFSALSVAQGFMFAGAPAVAMLKARGNFRTFLALQAVQLGASIALFFLCLTSAATLLGRGGELLGLPMPEGAVLPFAIAIGSTLAWGCFMPLTVWLACRFGGMRQSEAVGLFLVPLSVSAPFAILAWLSYRVLDARMGDQAASWTVLLGIAPVLFAGASLTCCWVRTSTRTDLKSLLAAMRTRMSGQPTPMA